MVTEVSPVRNAASSVYTYELDSKNQATITEYNEKIWHLNKLEL